MRANLEDMVLKLREEVASIASKAALKEQHKEI